MTRTSTSTALSASEGRAFSARPLAFDAAADGLNLLLNRSRNRQDRSCPCDWGTYTPNTTRVTAFQDLVSIANWNAAVYFHSFTETTLQMMLLRDVLAAKHGIPVAHRTGQEAHFHLFGIVGFARETVNTYAIQPGELFFAKRLVLPAQSRCGRPSRALISHLRDNYILPRSNPGTGSGRHRYRASRLPAAILDARAQAAERATETWEQGEAPPGGSGDEELPSWCIVVVNRTSTSTILTELAKIIPPHRIEVFHDGFTPVEHAWRLFGRARLLLGVHGSALTNMLYLPPTAAVLELRPRGYNNGVFHFLAAICQLDYLLLYGNGNKTTPLTISLADVVDMVKSLQPRFEDGT
eukprot:SM000141S00915  [mRNA]  locus=s141:314073:315584:- [translate_table: standard]